MNKKDKEQRKYVRIKDTLFIAVRSIQHAEELRKSIASGSDQDTSDSFGAQLKSIDDQFSLTLHSLGNRVPKTVELFTLLNKKLNLIAHHVLIKEVEEDHSEQEVNLSASGIGFSHQMPFAVDSEVAIDIMLTLTPYRIITKATITGCDAISEEDELSSLPGHRYYIRAQFEDLSEVDEETLIQHVIRRQSQLLKQQRLLKEQAEYRKP